MISKFTLRSWVILTLAIWQGLLPVLSAQQPPNFQTHTQNNRRSTVAPDGRAIPEIPEYLTHRNQTPLRKTITSAEDLQARQNAKFVVSRYLESRNPREMMQLAYLRSQIGKEGIEKIHNYWAYSQAQCAVTSGLGTRSHNCSQINPIGPAKELGDFVEDFSNAPYSKGYPLEGLLGFLSDIPVVGSGLGAVSKVGTNGNKVYGHYRGSGLLNEALSANGPPPSYKNQEHLLKSIEYSLYELFKYSSQSDVVRTYVDELSDKVAGKNLSRATEDDRRSVNERYHLARTVNEQGKEIDQLKQSLNGPNPASAEYERFLQGLAEIPPGALPYLNSKTLKTISPRIVDQWYAEVMNPSKAPASEDRYSLSGSTKDKYTHLSLWNSPDPDAKYSLGVNTDIEPDTSSPPDPDQLKFLKAVFNGISRFSPNPAVKGTAMVAEAGVTIALAALSGLTPFGLAAVVTETISGLVENLLSLFGSGPTMDEVILEKIKGLEYKVDKLIADTQTGLNSIIIDGISLQDHVRRNFDQLKRFGYQTRSENRDVRFHSERQMARLLQKIQQVDTNNQLRDLERRDEETGELYLGLHDPSLRLSPAQLEAKSEADVKDLIRNISRKYEPAINNLERRSLPLASDSVSIGSGTGSSDSKETELAERLPVNGIDNNLKLLHQYLYEKSGGRIDLRPKLPPYAGYDAERLTLKTKDGRMSDPVSLSQFISHLRKFHSIMAQKPDAAFPLTRNRPTWQCDADPDLGRLRFWLDMAVSQRQTLLDIIPNTSDEKLDASAIAPLFKAYENEINKGIGLVTEELISKLTDKNSPLKNYRPGVEPKDQVLPADVDLHDPMFWFGTKTPAIRACDSSRDGKEFLELGGGLGVEIANKLIPREFAVAKDLLGGSFTYCYEDIGVDDPHIQVERHGKDSKESRSVVAATHGKLGFTIKVLYEPVGKNPVEINAVRLTDLTENHQFYEQEYFPVWDNFHPGTPVSLNPSSRLKDDVDSMATTVSNWAKTEERFVGTFRGLFPTLEMRKADVWNQRVSMMRASWDSKLGAQALSSFGKEAVTPKFSVAKITKLNEKKEDLHTLNKLSIATEVRNEIVRIAEDILLPEGKSIDQGTGKLVEGLKPLDGARAALVSAIWLALGKKNDSPEFLALIEKLPTSFDVLGQVHVQSDLLKGNAGDLFIRSLMERSRNLYDHLLTMSGKERGHEELDRIIADLAELYFEQVRLRASNDGKIPCPSMADLPEALKPHFNSFKAVQDFVKGGQPFKLALPPPVISQSNLAAIGRLAKERAPLLSVSNLDEIYKMAQGWSDTKYGKVPSLPSNTDLPRDDIGRAVAAAEALQALIYDPEGPRLKPEDAVTRLREFEDELPSPDEIHSHERLTKALLKSPLAPVDRLWKTLMNADGISTDRIARFKAVQKELEQDPASRRRLRLRIDREIDSWTTIYDDLGNRISAQQIVVRETIDTKMGHLASNTNKIETVMREKLTEIDKFIEGLRSLSKRSETEADLFGLEKEYVRHSQQVFNVSSISYVKEPADRTDGNSEGAYSAQFHSPQDAVQVFEQLLNIGGRQRDMAKRERSYSDEVEESRRRGNNRYSPGGNGH